MSLPEVIDLFCGCGGLSLGFQKANYHINAGIDIDDFAIANAKYNLHPKDGDGVAPRHISKDLTTVDLNEITESHYGGKFIVIGGPPCQAYSRIGKGKLRSLGIDRHYLNDPRAQLYEHFLRIALEFDAEAIVMENVPDLLNFGGKNIPEIICDELHQSNYHAAWSILNAADYGVPQVRERIFIIAVKKKYRKEALFPTPTHFSIERTRTYWQYHITNSKYYQTSSIKSTEDLKPWVTVHQALSDLPKLFPDFEKKYVLNPLNLVLPYSMAPENEFQQLMRAWYNTGEQSVSGHSFRKTIRDFPIFFRMKPGDDFRDAHLIAEELFQKAVSSAAIIESEQPLRYNALRKKIVPPYAIDKFHEKWKKLDPRVPSHTLVAHLSIDTYSHIHPWEPRGISVREAARLQSFPDGYIFQGTMGDAFKQIGNAVPPLLSNAIALHLSEILGGKDGVGH